ncbi:autotransporter outer membrane beta-barrel domain-containing protein, partial [Synergistaceae bacterium OttesenSCG-928-D05]|nr:autotransporter outer membrane beta-barrel domain-containing protein [Synergistaceae bacterium OttesenSCG-928-D05]
MEVRIKKQMFTAFLLAAILLAAGCAAAVEAESNDVVITRNAEKVTLWSGQKETMTSLTVENQQSVALNSSVLVKSGAELTVEGQTSVTGNGKGTDGVRIEAGGTAYLNNVSVDRSNTFGIQNYGTTVISGDLDANNGAYGMYAWTGTAEVKGTTAAAGKNTIGVYVYDGGTAATGNVIAKDGAYGIQSKGILTVNGDVSADKGANGVFVSKGSADIKGTTTASGKGSKGIYAGFSDVTTGSIVALDSAIGLHVITGSADVRGTASAAGSGTTGIYIEGDGVASADNIVALDGATGVWVKKGSAAVTGTTTAAGEDTIAIYVVNGSASAGNIIAQDGAIGAEAYGGTIDAKNVTVGDNAYGLVASGGTINADGALVSGSNSYGAYALDGGTLNIRSDITISADAAGSYGAAAEAGGIVTVSGNIISTASGTAAGNVYGAHVSEGGTINVAGDIDMTGAYSLGATAESGDMTVGGNIVITGDNGYGAKASESGSILLADLINGGRIAVATSGGESHGLIAETQGTITMANADIEVASDTAWHMYVNSGGTIDLTGVRAGLNNNPNLLRTDGSGTVLAASSLLSGDIIHSGENDGILTLSLFEGSQLRGSVNANAENPGAGIDITLNAIGTETGATDYWYVTKDSSTQGSLTNRGVIDFAAAGGDYKTLTVNHFEGTTDGTASGQLAMRADVSANKSDRVHSMSATGDNYIDLRMMTYGGIERTDALIRIENQGETDPESVTPYAESDLNIKLMDNEATLNGVADAGAWTYTLEESMDGNAKEWYLKRHELTTLGWGLVMGAITPEMWYTEVATLYDRMGNYKDPNYKGGIWASASYRKVEFDGEEGAYTMLPFDVKMKTLTVGYDKKNVRSNGTWYNGVMLGYGRENLESSVGGADTDSFHATIYTVYRQENGFYLSALAKYNHYDTDVTVTAVDKLSRQLGYDKIEGDVSQRG